jgi:hypothetical protein
MITYDVIFTHNYPSINFAHIHIYDCDMFMCSDAYNPGIVDEGTLGIMDVFYFQFSFFSLETGMEFKDFENYCNIILPVKVEKKIEKQTFEKSCQKYFPVAQLDKRHCIVEVSLCANTSS